MRFSCCHHGNSIHKVNLKLVSVFACVCVCLTSDSRLRNSPECLRIRLYAWQHKSTNSWKRLVGRSPPLMTYAMSEVRTKGARSLRGQRAELSECVIETLKQG